MNCSENELLLNISTRNKFEICTVFKLIGFYMVVLLILSTVFNSLSLWIYYRAKLFKPTNYFMVVLLLLNLIATYIEAPNMIYNSFYCK